MTCAAARAVGVAPTGRAATLELEDTSAPVGDSSRVLVEVPTTGVECAGHQSTESKSTEDPPSDETSLEPPTDLQAVAAGTTVAFQCKVPPDVEDGDPPRVSSELVEISCS